MTEIALTIVAVLLVLWAADFLLVLPVSRHTKRLHKRLREEREGPAGALDFFSCSVCGERRPEHRISVWPVVLRDRHGRAWGRRNVRYCADRDDCRTTAASRYEGEIAL